MTIDISANVPRISYTVAAGVTQTSFAVPFEFFDDTDLNVYVDETLQTITTNYTVTGGSGSTGTITMTVTGAKTVIITRDTTIERTTDFTAGVDINRAALNTQLDTLTAIAADNKDLSERGIRIKDFDPTTASLELPDASTRADKLLSFDTEGGVSVQAASDLLTGSVLGANYTKASYTGNGTQTAYNTVESAGSKNNIQVYIDGVYQNKDTFSISGTTLTFTEAPPLNSAIEFIVGNAITSITTDPDVVTYNQGSTGAQDRTLTSKLQDTVSVKDFGAVGNGTADDTAAIQAAIDAAYNSGSQPVRAVYVPSGTYKITSTLTGRVSIIGEMSGKNNVGAVLDYYGSDNKVINFPSYTIGYEFKNFRINLQQITTATICMYFAQGLVGARFHHVEFRGNFTTTEGRLYYKSQSSNFTVGQTLTGGTSSATATISADQDNGTDGYLTLTGISGTFSAGETITDGGGGSATATNFNRKQYQHDGIYIVGGDGASTKYDTSINEFNSVYFTSLRRGLEFTDPSNLASGGENTFTNSFGNCEDWVFKTTGPSNIWIGGDYSCSEGQIFVFDGNFCGGNVISGVAMETNDNDGDTTYYHIKVESGAGKETVFSTIGTTCYVRAATFGHNGESELKVNDAGIGSSFRRYNQIGDRTPTPTVKATQVDTASIKFPATQVSYANVNTLDDYEEGTFQPEIFYTDATNQAAATNQTQTGIYTKVGNLVTLNFRLEFTAPSGLANDNIGVKNLPFASNSSSGRAVGAVTTSGTSLTSGEGIVLELGASSSTAILGKTVGGGNLGDDVGTGASRFFNGTITYVTAT